jgi:hypothetical protein
MHELNLSQRTMRLRTEFKQGMVARAEMLGDTGENHPDN